MTSEQMYYADEKAPLETGLLVWGAGLSLFSVIV